MFRRQQRSTLFPYTTLFRSQGYAVISFSPQRALPPGWAFISRRTKSVKPRLRRRQAALRPAIPISSFSKRSEEHTSELQSHVNLVCRLLLEKKNSHLVSCD